MTKRVLVCAILLLETETALQIRKFALIGPFLLSSQLLRFRPGDSLLSTRGHFSLTLPSCGQKANLNSTVPPAKGRIPVFT